MTHEELSYLLMIVATATDKESDQDALSHHAATANKATDPSYQK